jgi:hypothetical protein
MSGLRDVTDADVSDLIEGLALAITTLHRVVAWRYSPSTVEALASLTLDELLNLREEFVQDSDDDEPD